MPQENQVLRCFSCKMFQVHIVKKVKKWECKICHSKQSVQQVYGKGSGKDCRLHCMKLNELQITSKENCAGASHESESQYNSILQNEESPELEIARTRSKWSCYVTGPVKASEDPNQNMNLMRSKSKPTQENQMFENENGRLFKDSNSKEDNTQLDLSTNTLEAQSIEIDNKKQTRPPPEDQKTEYFKPVLQNEEYGQNEEFKPKKSEMVFDENNMEDLDEILSF